MNRRVSCSFTTPLAAICVLGFVSSAIAGGGESAPVFDAKNPPALKNHLKWILKNAKLEGPATTEKARLKKTFAFPGGKLPALTFDEVYVPVVITRSPAWVRLMPPLLSVPESKRSTTENHSNSLKRLRHLESQLHATDALPQAFKDSLLADLAASITREQKNSSDKGRRFEIKAAEKSWSVAWQRVDKVTIEYAFDRRDRLESLQSLKPGDFTKQKAQADLTPYKAEFDKKFIFWPKEHYEYVLAETVDQFQDENLVKAAKEKK